MRDAFARLLDLALRRLSWLFAVVIIVPIVIVTPEFRRADYWYELTYQFFAPAALAMALTPIIVTGGIDLSIGSVSVLSSVIIGALWRDAHWPMAAAMAAGLAMGSMAGVANGFFCVVGVLPLVATLATRELFRGAAFSLSGAHPVDRFPPELALFWREPLLGLPVPLVAAGFVFTVTYCMLHHTWIGRMAFAIGDNANAARFAGVPVRGVKLLLYGWSGLVAGLCGVGLVLKYGAAKADAEPSLELAAVTYVVMGGVRVTGGAGSVAGTVLGIVTVSVLLQWLTSFQPTWRDSVTGLLLIVVAICNEAAARWLARRQ